MFKKFLFACTMLFLMLSSAMAAVDVNSADQAALDSIKGIGAAKSKAILEERSKNGPFKDWADFEKRVRGFAAKSTDALSKNGMTINGQSKGGVAADTKAAAGTKASAPAASASATAASAGAPAAAASAPAASAPAAAASKASVPAPSAAAAKAAVPAPAASASVKASAPAAASASASKK